MKKILIGAAIIGTLFLAGCGNTTPSSWVGGGGTAVVAPVHHTVKH